MIDPILMSTVPSKGQLCVRALDSLVTWPQGQLSQPYASVTRFLLATNLIKINEFEIRSQLFVARIADR
jgi:hypothetical protein